MNALDDGTADRSLNAPSTVRLAPLPPNGAPNRKRKKQAVLAPKSDPRRPACLAYRRNIGVKLLFLPESTSETAWLDEKTYQAMQFKNVEPQRFLRSAADSQKTSP
jgi:hypothetical protein